MSVLLTLLFNIVQEVLGITLRKKKKGIKIGKEGIKLSLFINDLVIYVENLMKSTKLVLELVSVLSKVVGYETNIEKSIEFLYTSNKGLP